MEFSSGNAKSYFDFSILTPTFNPPAHLCGCIASIKREAELLIGTNIKINHCIQDGNSQNISSIVGIDSSCLNSNELLKYQFQLRSQNDQGMYDAINRAFKATDGAIIGHLNADEQYLPGTLALVAETFQSNPEVDVVSGAAVIVDGNGQYFCTRPAVIPTQIQLELCYLSLFTCATFFRRDSLHKLGMYFDDSYRFRGDAELFTRVLKNRLNIHVIPKPLSVFVDDGNNLALSKGAVEEKLRMRQRPALAAFVLKPMTAALIRLKLLKAFQSVSKPFEYTWIQPDGSSERIYVTRPRLKWPRRTIREVD